ncbi:MAG: hypothetical protein KTR14_03370 [Vampirovibrio sp.]|nr:hypothetical protein [Vampirovibrio sp.]
MRSVCNRLTRLTATALTVAIIGGALYSVEANAQVNREDIHIELSDRNKKSVEQGLDVLRSLLNNGKTVTTPSETVETQDGSAATTTETTEATETTVTTPAPTYEALKAENAALKNQLEAVRNVDPDKLDTELNQAKLRKEALNSQIQQLVNERGELEKHITDLEAKRQANLEN